MRPGGEAGAFPIWPPEGGPRAPEPGAAERRAWPRRPGPPRRGPGRRPGSRNLLLGLARLACCRAEGLAEFGDDAQAFLASLAPLIAFPLVGTGLALAKGQGVAVAVAFAQTVCGLLAPSVLSQALAARWGRGAEWFRYATAANWCQWLMPMALAFLLILAGIATQAGVPERLLPPLVVGLLAVYALRLQFFLVRHGLALPRGRSLLLVVTVMLGTAVLVLGPALVAGAARGNWSMAVRAAGP